MDTFIDLVVTTAAVLAAFLVVLMLAGAVVTALLERSEGHRVEGQG